MILRSGFLAAMFAFQVWCLKPEGCDTSLNSWFREGILGQVGMFPWLGVIRVQLYEGVQVRIALTGAILINENFALTIADDIARIPRKIFQRDSKALFIPTDGQPWLCNLKNYTTHPEYSTYKNTIALIELEFEDNGPAPLVPICWPTHSYSYNASSQLHVFGITDANDVLEKEVYTVQHVPQSECIQWYRREGLYKENDPWRDYLCVSAANNKKECVYETGMVLASNATGTWTMHGFGLHGPGCAAPSRFIQIYKYIPWIESISNAQNGGSLAKALREGSEDAESEQDTPAHKLYSKNIFPYDFQWYESGLGTEVVRIDKDAILVITSQFEMNPGDCFHKSRLVYSDSVKIFADKQTGAANCKLSLMDRTVMSYSNGCILVRLNAERSSKTRLWYNYGNYIEPLNMGEATPKELLKKYLIPEWHNSTKTKKTTPTTQPKKLDRVQRRAINNIRRYKKLISNSVINELQAIKNKLGTTRNGLNGTRKADINKISKKMFAIKRKLKDITDELGFPVPDSLKDSISILDKAASELRAGLIFYQGKLMDARKAEVQQSIDLLKKLRESPITTDQPEIKVEANEKRKAKGRQGAVKEEPWKPHRLLEPEFITDRPGWWLTSKHLNLELDFVFNSEAELLIEVWGFPRDVVATPAPEIHTTKTRTQTTTAKNTVKENENGGDTPKAEGSDTPKAEGGDTPKAEGGDTPKTEGGDTPKADGGDTPKTEGGDTPKAEGGDTPKADGGDASKADGGDASKADGGDTPNAGVDSSPINGNDRKPKDSRKRLPSREKSFLTFLRKDAKRIYSELKRAEYNDFEVIKMRGTDIYDELTDDSNIVRSRKLCIVAVIFCLLLCN